jgi:nicotinamidase-related amidase
MKALLIIDMQEVSFTAATPRFDQDGVIQRINLLSEKFRKNGYVVIFIQHDGFREGYCIPNTPEWNILSALEIKENDLFISKTANDSFYNTTLRDSLIRSGIEDIVITGCATDFCVDATVKSALINDFSITVIADGHTTADRTNITAKQLIDHYNWIWQEMTPTRTRIKVVGFESYMKSLSLDDKRRNNPGRTSGKSD